MDATSTPGTRRYSLPAGDRSLTVAALLGGPFPGGSLRRGSRRCSAFTLVEMVIVVAVALVLLSIILPSATALWSQRRISDAANTVKGSLMVARARAMRTGGLESGLFFYLDGSGAQRIAQIEQLEPQPYPNSLTPNGPPDPTERLNLARQRAFRITDEADQILPRPMRVVPRYVVKPPGTGDAAFTFTDFELSKTSAVVAPLAPGDNEAQRHRNFFTMIYSPEGKLLVWRDVVIQDSDTEIGPTHVGNGIGDRAGLRVGKGPPGDTPKVRRFYPVDAPNHMALDPDNDPRGWVERLITQEGGAEPAAINFPSVDGLLIYDESFLADVADGAERREIILRTAQPYYVSPATGAVIKGPVGEVN